MEVDVEAAAKEMAVMAAKAAQLRGALQAQTRNTSATEQLTVAM